MVLVKRFYTFQNDGHFVIHLIKDVSERPLVMPRYLVVALPSPVIAGNVWDVPLLRLFDVCYIVPVTRYHISGR